MTPSNSEGTVFEFSDADRWVGVFLLAVAAFTIVTSEFLPIGILTQLSHAFGKSEGVLGLAVTLPGILAALSGPAAVFLSAQLIVKLLW